jgi:hypothetical protein
MLVDMVINRGQKEWGLIAKKISDEFPDSAKSGK